MTAPSLPRHRRALRLAAPLALLALGACASVENLRIASMAEVSALTRLGSEGWPRTARLDRPLAPVARPARPLMAGFRAEDLLRGGTLRLSVAHLGRAGVRVRQSDGCTWTRSGDWFAPSDSWQDCGTSKNWKTGRAKVKRTGSLWPLRPGAEARWTRRAVSHTGRRLTRETRCRVTHSETVLRRSGPTPAHVVVCTDGKRTRTTWFAPRLGPVAFRVDHAGNGVEDAWVRH